MHIITYISAARRLLSQEEILHLLVKSRDANESFDITGMLLYHEGTFMQTIEGPTQHVMQLWRNIQKDVRHHHISPILDEPISERVFPHWRMGFRGQLKEDTTPGFSDFLSSPATIAEFVNSPLEAKRLLANFASTLR